MATEMILKGIGSFFNDMIPLHQHIGLRVTDFDTERVEIRFSFDDKLVGNMTQQILHGGVTSTAMDVAGGLMAIASVIEKMEDLNDLAILQKRLAKVGTVNLRVDYLRPGRGKEFIVTAKVIRSGNKVAVTSMEMHNEEEIHIAFGTGTYLIG